MAQKLLVAWAILCCSWLAFASAERLQNLETGEVLEAKVIATVQRAGVLQHFVRTSAGEERFLEAEKWERGAPELLPAVAPTPVVVYRGAPRSASWLGVMYREHKRRIAYVDERYVRLPNFELTYASSARRTRREAEKLYPPLENEKEWTRDRWEWRLVYRFDFEMRERLAAARRKDIERYLNELIESELRVGGFGTLYDARIQHVLGPDEMVVRFIRIVQPTPWAPREEIAGAMIRVKGYSTATLADGLLWAGEIAIIGNWSYEDPDGIPRTLLNAIPLEQVRRGLTLEQFAEALRQGVALEG